MQFKYLTLFHANTTIRISVLCNFEIIQLLFFKRHAMVEECRCRSRIRETDFTFPLSSARRQIVRNWTTYFHRIACAERAS